MTKETSKYIQLLDAMSKIHEIEDLLKRESDDRPEKSKLIKEKLIDRAYKEMDSDLAPFSKEELKKETVYDVLNTAIIVAGETSASLLSKSGDLEDILKETPSQSFERMSNAKEIVEKASGDEKKVFSACAQWQGFENFKKNYQDGNKLSDEQEKTAVEYGIKGLGDKVAQKYKALGFSEKVQDSMKKIAYQAAKYHYVDINEYVVPGLEATAKEHKDKYEETAKKYGNVADMSKKILKKLVMGNKDEFYTARALLYQTSDRCKEVTEKLKHEA